MKQNTSTLLNEIKSSKSLDDVWMNEHEESMIESMELSEFLEEMLIRHDTKKNEVIKRSSLDQTYAYQIFQGLKKKPYIRTTYEEPGIQPKDGHGKFEWPDGRVYIQGPNL